MTRTKRRARREENEEESIRLNRYLAMLGLGSRRECDEIISSGRVFVDGKQAETPAQRIIPGTNRITVSGRNLNRTPGKLVLLLNKPTGVITTASDPQGRQTVTDLCRRQGFKMRLFSVGRLDINTSGAILLTNDGLLCYRLTHPKYQIPRVYNVRVRGVVTDKKMRRLKKLASPIAPLSKASGTEPEIELIKGLDRQSILRIVLFEGRNRQVRKICKGAGLDVLKLKRVSFAGISIRKLPLGSVRPLTKKEIDRLEKITSRKR